ncbi:MAG: class I SAM-dependent methyltransferase [Spirochaetales bacterium]|nr:class I SAM-dependent methyltransferase [Spirochaetales bacterium]
MYDLIAEQYSQLFPPDQRRAGFIADELSPQAIRILDAGCATGDLSFELATRGYSITGIDFNKAMVNIAVERAAGGTLAPEFLHRNMLAIDDLGKYDGIVCFGNTLPHLLCEEDVLSFLITAGRHLNQGGRLIIQIINFNVMMKKSSFDFPEIETETTVFNRRYEVVEGGFINFMISTIDKTSGMKSSGSVKLLPLYQNRMLKLLKAAGFKDISVYKDYDHHLSDESEFASIYSAFSGNVF